MEQSSSGTSMCAEKWLGEGKVEMHSLHFSASVTLRKRVWNSLQSPSADVPTWETIRKWSTPKALIINYLQPFFL